MKAKEIAIKGKVHDVGYRLFLLREAESIFIEKVDARKNGAAKSANPSLQRDCELPWAFEPP